MSDKTKTMAALLEMLAKAVRNTQPEPVGNCSPSVTCDTRMSGTKNGLSPGLRCQSLDRSFLFERGGLKLAKRFRFRSSSEHGNSYRVSCHTVSMGPRTRIAGQQLPRKKRRSSRWEVEVGMSSIDVNRLADRTFMLIQTVTIHGWSSLQ